MTDHLTANGEEIKVYDLERIDLSNPNIHESAALLRKACMESGIFYVINHGISQEFMDETFSQFKRFLDLPIEEKMKLVCDKPLRGYGPPNRSYIDDKTKLKVGLAETFHIGIDVSEDDPTAQDFLQGQNIWPPADLLPGFREAMHKYQQEATNVGRRIGKIIAVALNLSEDFFDQPELIGSANANYNNMFHYGGYGAELSNDVVGSPPHCDLNLITLLATDDIWGLQICREKNTESLVWEAIAPLKGAFIVNVGDMLEILTNGLFRSILHRVVVDHERYSSAAFMCPHHDYIIKCLPTCISEENPPKYPTIRTGQYIYNRLVQMAASTVEKEVKG
ncbi:2-oxoglutarate (2OG) and Fe(II)-dependent oxygenase superfamily protein [Melia azedarach]|uniref:2-oxoglutarate (2OG) and Fe(II)-dependent oxygenase superfamily protein n=1 Tax=Melia azedarach TaxID=155640 RepID=A0ACC1XR73_MELAZ|nr:2-oxoglutarate (2OG) and Fe(II)-dependent oxygenase superfamily protein [Melia azedarach]